MFRTKLDLKLKKQRESGPPFFNLRETIAIILLNHVTDPEVRLEALLFGRVENTKWRNGEMVLKIRAKVIRYNHSDKIIERIVNKRFQQTGIHFHFVLARLHICTALQSLLCIYLI